MRALVLCAAAGAAALCSGLAHASLPANTQIIELPSKRTLLDIGPQHAMTFGDAAAACAKIGGSPADLYDNEDLSAVARAIDAPRWIKSFNGQYFGEVVPAAVYPGPAIAAPPKLGDEMLGVLCQVY